MPWHWNYRKGSPEELKADTSKSKADKRQGGEKKTMIRGKAKSNVWETVSHPVLQKKNIQNFPAELWIFLQVSLRQNSADMDIDVLTLMHSETHNPMMCIQDHRDE